MGRIKEVSAQIESAPTRYYLVRFKPCRFLKFLVLFCTFLSVLVVFYPQYWSVFIMSLVLLFLTAPSAFYIKVKASLKRREFEDGS